MLKLGVVKTLTAFIVCACLSLSSCMVIGRGTPPVEFASHWAFCLTPPVEQKKSFPNLPPQVQLDTYLICMLYYHPPQIGLAYYFAQTGSEGVRLIATKLSVTTDEITILDLIFALRIFSDLKTYDVAGDAVTIDIAWRAVDRVNDVWTKETCTKYIDKILATKKKDQWGQDQN